jgi:hypothetical protein
MELCRFTEVLSKFGILWQEDWIQRIRPYFQELRSAARWVDVPIAISIHCLRPLRFTGTCSLEIDGNPLHIDTN